MAFDGDAPPMAVQKRRRWFIGGAKLGPVPSFDHFVKSKHVIKAHTSSQARAVVGVGVGVGVVARVTSPKLPAPSVFSECLLVLVVGELGVLQLFLHCDVVLHTNARGVGSSLNPNPTCGALERRCCVR